MSTPILRCSKVVRSLLLLVATVCMLTTPMRADFDGDGKSDLAVWRASEATWYILPSGGGSPYSVQWGISSDVPLVGDFDGDGKSDYAVWRASEAKWYVLLSGGGDWYGVQFGISSDVPLVGDFDGDGKSDLAVWRASEAKWYFALSGGGLFGVPFGSGVQFGISSDVPLVGDFDGDGKSDLAVWRASEAKWYFALSGGGGLFGVPFGSGVQWGISSDVPLVGDFDGDGKSDLALWRASDATWYILPSGGGSQYSVQWGISTDVPQVGDYDGDGKSDLAVWRASEAKWYVLLSGGGDWYGAQFGITTDLPIPNPIRRVRISGEVLGGGSGLPGATVSLTGTTAAGTGVSLSTTTDATGNYLFAVPAGGSYTITPTDAGGDTFQSSVPQPLTSPSVSETVNFTDNGNGGYTAPPYPNFLNSVPSPGPGPANCANISGSWTDSNSNNWALLQAGGTVSGSVIQPSTGVVWQISGSGTGAQYTLTASNPSPSMIDGEYEDGESLVWNSTSCNSATGVTTYIAPPGFDFASTGTSTEPGPTITLVRPAAPTYTLTSPSSSPVPGSTNGAQYMAFSTGDSNVQLKTTASLPNISVNEVYTASFQGDPNSTCANGSHVALSMADGIGTGSATSSISASPAGCSGIFQIWGAGGGTTTNLLEVVVPPQIMIQTLVGEAGAQTQPGDDTMVALLLTARNRFGDKDFAGGSTKTWQGVLTAPYQYQGASNPTSTGVQPELTYAAEVYSGATTVDILNCQAYWSPTNLQFATLQSWANTPANAMTDDDWKAIGAPGLWKGEPKQAVIKKSIGNNVRAGYNAAPAIVLFREAPSGAALTVITIP